MAVKARQLDELARRMPQPRKDPAAIKQRVEAMEKLLERSFVVPGLRLPIGLDFIAGLVPVVGDFITAAMGGYIVWEARNLGMSRWHLMRMTANIGFDTLLGAVPGVGDAFDLFYRSNTRNLKMIRKHLDRHHPGLKTIDQ